MKKIKLPKINIKNPFKIVKSKKDGDVPQIFFGSAKRFKFDEKKIENLIDIFFEKSKSYIETMRQGTQVEDRRFPKDRIYDFYKHMEIGTFNFSNNLNGVPTFGQPQAIDGDDVMSDLDIAPAVPLQQIDYKSETKKPDFVQKKPIEVFDELERLPNPVILQNLDENIELLKKKERLSSQVYTQYNINAAIQCLENRKKYDDYKEFFDKFPYTNSDKISELVDKYRLAMKESEIFVPEFPKEAIDIMDAYQEATKMLCGKKPTFYVIATKEDFVDKDKKRDPILLVQSPFGFYWQILGAWEKEMVLLSEL